MTGIEPAWPAWKAGALPLSYTRIITSGECPSLGGSDRWFVRSGGKAIGSGWEL